MKKAISFIGIFIAVFCINITLSSAETIQLQSIGSGQFGYKDGDPSIAAFRFPHGLAEGKNGELLIIDSYNNVIRKISKDRISTIGYYSEGIDSYWFPQGAYVDGNIEEARFNHPRDIAVDTYGNIFVADTDNHVIRSIKNGKVYTFAGDGKAGYEDGRGIKARFNTPSGIAIDKDNNLYIADTLNHVIRKISTEGEVTTLTGKIGESGGYKDGTLKEALFNEPTALKMDDKGILYVVDSGNQRIRAIEEGEVKTIAGAGMDKNENGYIIGGYKDGTANEAQFNFPKGIDVSKEGIIFVADTYNHQIRMIIDNEVFTLKLVDDSLYGPIDVLYQDGFLYIADMWNNRIQKVPINKDKDLFSNEDIESIAPQMVLTPGEIQVWANGEKIEFKEEKPYTNSGKIMVPIRKLCESFGAKVIYDTSTKEILILKDSLEKSILIDKAPVSMQNGRAMVHIEFLAETLGYHVMWVEEYDTVVISLR